MGGCLRQTSAPPLKRRASPTSSRPMSLVRQSSNNQQRAQKYRAVHTGSPSQSSMSGMWCSTPDPFERSKKRSPLAISSARWRRSPSRGRQGVRPKLFAASASEQARRSCARENWKSSPAPRLPQPLRAVREGERCGRADRLSTFARQGSCGLRRLCGGKPGSKTLPSGQGGRHSPSDA